MLDGIGLKSRWWKGKIFRLGQRRGRSYRLSQIIVSAAGPCMLITLLTCVHCTCYSSTLNIVFVPLLLLPSLWHHSDNNCRKIKLIFITHFSPHSPFSCQWLMTHLGKTNRTLFHCPLIQNETFCATSSVVNEGFSWWLSGSFMIEWTDNAATMF